MIKTARRTRKYRRDALVHLVYDDGTYHRSIKILCTNFWVHPQQVEFVDEVPTCLACISKGES